MIDISILDKERRRIHIIDTYNSLIWANRYYDKGDCEIKIPASIKNLMIFKEGMYIARDDDEMVCRIEDIELETDIEEGDYLIVKGYDIKKILSQRIVWNQTNFNGLVEDYIRKLIYENIINPSIESRKISNFMLGEKVGFTEELKQQVTYDQIDDKVEEICKNYKWGYKVIINDLNEFVFQLYKGKNKSETVIFSDEYENLVSTEYIENQTNVKNVALIAGEGEGTERITNVIGEASDIDRYELYVDARDISKSTDYNELIKSYPNGKQVTVGGTTYYQVDGVNIAIIVKDEEVGDIIETTLTDEIYEKNLISKGEENLAQRKSSKTYAGAIAPTSTFKYKEDYYLGDIVTVENKYGISVECRIVEVIEVCDENGYSIEPKYEYLEDTTK